MLRTGWTWAELMATPAYVVEAVIDQLAKQSQPAQSQGADPNFEM